MDLCLGIVVKIIGLKAQISVGPGSCSSEESLIEVSNSRFISVLNMEICFSVTFINTFFVVNQALALGGSVFNISGPSANLNITSSTCTDSGADFLTNFIVFNDGPGAEPGE